MKIRELKNKKIKEFFDKIQKCLNKTNMPIQPKCNYNKEMSNCMDIS